MSRRLVSLTLIALLLAGPARAQLVVIDPGNLVQAILIADRTLQEYTTLTQQYQTILRMAQGLGPLVQYRMPPIGITAHDPSRWLYGAPWLQGLNTGDAQGALYEQTARPLERPNGVLDPLPPSAQQAIEDAYATIEITDSIAEIAGNQVALVRGYSGTLQQATQTYENDVLNTLPGYHDMTAVLDKVAVGELLARRQDMATNQLLSHALEQLLARSVGSPGTELEFAL